MQLLQPGNVLPLPFSKQEIKQSPERVVREMLKDAPHNLRRTEGVVAMACEIAKLIPKHTGDLLILAAYYHNIGASKYLSEEIDFIPLRGAMWANSVGLPPSVVRSIFELSGSRLFAKLNPGAAPWYAMNEEKPSPLGMYLCYCDLRVDSDGGISTMPVRYKEMQDQCAEGAAYSKIISILWPYFQEVMLTVERRLRLQFDFSPGQL